MHCNCTFASDAQTCQAVPNYKFIPKGTSLSLKEDTFYKQLSTDKCLVKLDVV